VLTAEALALAPEERLVGSLPVGKRTITFAFGCCEVSIYPRERHDLDTLGFDDAHRPTREQRDDAEIAWFGDGLASDS
jgi:hypothetical protein